MPRNLQGTLERMARKIVNLNENDHFQGFQRRNQVVDLYGYEFQRQGSTGNPAVVYVSISQDLIYYHRFEFKLIITPFIIPIAGGGTNSIELEIRGTTADASNNNPHNHESGTLVVDPATHNHTVTAGITSIQSDFSDFRIIIEGIDMTELLMAQYGGEWIEGEGIYPRNDLSNYDILEAAGYLSE